MAMDIPKTIITEIHIRKWLDVFKEIILLSSFSFLDPMVMTIMIMVTLKRVIMEVHLRK